MRYQASYKTRTRSRIIKATARLAKGNGFAASGVDQLMHAAGLSGSAFYKHFAGKAELLRAIVAHELQQSLQFFVVNEEASVERWLQHTVRGYFSRLNLDSPESGCMLPSLASEVARSDRATRLAFEEGMSAIAAAVGARLDDSAGAWALLAQLVGAVVIARAMATPTARARVLAGCRQSLRATPGKPVRRAPRPATSRRQQ